MPTNPELHDNPTTPGVNKYGDPNLENQVSGLRRRNTWSRQYNTNLPELHEVLRKHPPGFIRLYVTSAD